MLFGDAAKFTFPIAVENHPIDMAFARVGFPAVGFGRVEIDIPRGAGGIVGVQHGDNRLLADKFPHDASGDFFAREIGEHFVFQLRGIGAALAMEVSVVYGSALAAASDATGFCRGHRRRLGRGG